MQRNLNTPRLSILTGQQSIAQGNNRMINVPGKIHFAFTATPWQYKGSGWVFVTVPKEMSDDIRRYFKKEEQGWGRLSIIARSGNTTWPTAIWFDTQHQSYLLPLKSKIRKKENIAVGELLDVLIFVQSTILTKKSRIARYLNTCSISIIQIG